ncbi:MAG TPA: hypothetical protein O0W80_01995 [Methanocorpusculum sp.]|nr:hypothetical protein [Methanocorpusculum sp.]
MSVKFNVLKAVVCIALIFVLFSVPVCAVTVSDFASLKEAVENGGEQTILISEDIDMGYITIPAHSDITLKPEGKSVVLSFERFDEDKSECIYVRQNSNLTLSGNDGHTLTIKGLDGSPILVSNIGKLTLESGTILTDHTTTANYGGVKSKGLFVMNGGVISHITGKSGGAVSIIEGGSFIMNEGIIKENTANNGAGIYLTEGSVSINGGTVSQNIGHDIEITTVSQLRSSISISGNAVISSIHFQNAQSGNAVPKIQAASDFTGEISSISYTEYVPKTKTVEFQSPDAAQTLQNKFSIANEDYSLIPYGNYLIVEPSPDFQFVLDKSTEVIIPKYPINIPVSLKVTNGKLSSIVVTSILSDENGNEVQGIPYTYDVKDGVFGAVGRKENVLTLSTGKDITENNYELITLIISDTDLRPGKYTVTISIESSVSNEYDYTKYPTQTLTAAVQVIPLILESTSNTNGADIFGTPIWSFSQKAAVTYIISPFEASLDEKWPSVSRHSSPSYENKASELTKVQIYKSDTQYSSANEWIPASSTVDKNQDGTIHFNLEDNDKDAKCFKIVFSGRKLGDVVEGTGDIDNVNLYDVDMILHAAVSPTIYIKPEWRLYADTDSDGKIQLGDAIDAFNFIKGH